MTVSWTTPATFVNDTVPDAATFQAQIVDNIAYLRQEMPSYVHYQWGQFSIDSTLTWNQTIDTSQIFNFYWVASPSADGTLYYCAAVLAAGTYTLSALGLTVYDQGKLDWALGGTSIATGQDWYSASTVYNVTKTVTGIVVPRGGRYILSATVNGKNVSSSAYYIRMTRISLVRDGG